MHPSHAKERGHSEHGRKFRKPAPPQRVHLKREEVLRQKNLGRIVKDRLQTALDLNMAPQRLGALIDGNEPITPEIAMFIEETLSLKPGILDSAAGPTQLTIVSNNNTPRSEGEHEMSAQAAAPTTTKKEKLVLLRCDNVDKLGASARGVKAGICRQLGRGDNLFSLLRSSKVSFDDDLARKIESIVGVPTNWLDKPQTTVPQLAPWVYTRGTAPAPRERVVHRSARKPTDVALPPPAAATTPVGSAPAAASPAGVTTKLVEAMVETVRTYAAHGKVDDRKALKILNVLAEE